MHLPSEAAYRTMTFQLPILMYHKIGPRPRGALVPFHYVSEARFRNQVRALVRFGFQTVSLADCFGASRKEQLPGRPICLTFDDGYESFAALAVPTLAVHSQTATVFVVSSLLGLQNEWDTRIGDMPEPLMGEESVRTVHAMGFEVGSHSMTHARLTEVDQNVLRAEVQGSKAKLEALLEGEVRTFCYPYGSQDESVRNAVQEAGYECACSVEKGWNNERTNPFRLRRTNVRSDTSTPVLFWKLWRQSRMTPDAS